MAVDPDDMGPKPPPLGDDEADFRASFALLVDWYRVSQTPILRRAFLPAALGFVPLGGVLIALASGGRVIPPALAPHVILAGVLAMALGPAWCAFTLLYAMRSDAYVAIRTDGLALRLDINRPEELIAWDDIEEAHYDATHDTAELVLRDRPSQIIRGPFTQVTLAELIRRIRDARRLAVWQRLTPRASVR